MSQLPDGIDLRRHRDFQGRELGQWLRRLFLLLIFAFAVAALLNAFGQRPTTLEARAAPATLKVSAPSSVRGGLLYQATFTIHATAALRKPILRLDRGWYEQTTVNTIEPEPEQTTSDEDHVDLEYPALATGQTLVIYVDMQANPTNVGSHDAGAALLDGARQIAAVDRTQINWP
jgi:hypothetical protein